MKRTGIVRMVLTRARFLMIPALLLLACAPALYIPTAEQAARTGIPIGDLNKGRELYIDHCGSCHMLYLPNQFTTEQWKEEMVAMRPKVSLSDTAEALILQFLLAGK